LLVSPRRSQSENEEEKQRKAGKQTSSSRFFSSFRSRNQLSEMLDIIELISIKSASKAISMRSSGSTKRESEARAGKIFQKLIKKNFSSLISVCAWAGRLFFFVEEKANKFVIINCVFGFINSFSSRLLGLLPRIKIMRSWPRVIFQVLHCRSWLLVEGFSRHLSRASSTITA
jgi:hypothetical protein